MSSVEEEVLVVTSTGSGHLFPCIELCKHLSSSPNHSFNYKPTLILPSNLSSSLPPSLQLSTAEISPSPNGGPPSPAVQKQMGLDIEAHLSRCSAGPDSSPLPVCAVVDFQMGWTKHVFWKFGIPVISFFTFGACAAAMEWGAWKSDAGKITPGDVLTIPGLPEDMSLNFSDVKRRQVKRSGSTPAGRGGGGPPKPGDRPPWVPLIEGSIGLMFNTCEYLEGPFLNYMASQMGMPVWGVGPLLPERYWQKSDTLISDQEIRQAKHHSSYSEDQVIRWLDSKPHGSVLYVAFGSEVGPTAEEYPLLAGALEDSTRPFIWVIQHKSSEKLESYGSSGEETAHYALGMEERVGDRGLIIQGWAPQLLILSHPSTGGFLSHCGWNSTVEAIGRGVPFLAWPIRGDQFYNAKLAVNHLKVGYMVTMFTRDDDDNELTEWRRVRKEDILQGIEKLMSDEEVQERVAMLRVKFDTGVFPTSSKTALDVFKDFIRQTKVI